MPLNSVPLICHNLIIIEIKKYLQNQDLIICREGAIIELNYQKVNTWKRRNPIKSFYNYYFDKRDLKISECLYKIGEIQQNDREWISVNKANFIVEKYFAEIKFLQSIGCEQLIRCLGSNIPDVVLYEIRKQSFNV